MKIPCLLFLSQNNKRGAHFQQGSNTSMMILGIPSRGSLSGSSKRRWWTVYWVDVSLPSVLSLSLFFLSFLPFSFSFWLISLFCNNYFVISRNVLARTSRLRAKLTVTYVTWFISILTAWIFRLSFPTVHTNKQKKSQPKLKTLPCQTHTQKK